MALRHSVRHLDPHGHRHGPRRDELHSGRIALGLRLCSAPSTTRCGHPQTQHAPRPGPWGVRMKKSYRRCDEKSEYKRYECSLSFVIHRPCGLVAEMRFMWPAIDLKEAVSGFLFYLMTIPIESIRPFFFFLACKVSILSRYHQTIRPLFLHFPRFSYIAASSRISERVGWMWIVSWRSSTVASRQMRAETSWTMSAAWAP